MRKIDGVAAAEPFGGGHRLTLKARSGEQVCMDLSADAAATLASQLQPERSVPADESSDAPATESTESSRPAGRRRHR